MTIDFSLTDHGSIVLLYPHTDAAHDWLADNVEEDGPRWGGAFWVIEPRYMADIVAGMEEAGLQKGEAS